MRNVRAAGLSRRKSRLPCTQNDSGGACAANRRDGRERMMAITTPRRAQHQCTYQLSSEWRVTGAPPRHGMASRAREMLDIPRDWRPSVAGVAEPACLVSGTSLVARCGVVHGVREAYQAIKRTLVASPPLSPIPSCKIMISILRAVISHCALNLTPRCCATG